MIIYVFAIIKTVSWNDEMEFKMLRALDLFTLAVWCETDVLQTNKVSSTAKEENTRWKESEKGRKREREKLTKNFTSGNSHFKLTKI